MSEQAIVLYQVGHVGFLQTIRPDGFFYLELKHWVVQVDAFTDVRFSGNPAAVCLLHRPVDDVRRQQIAAEMNLSETAFLESVDGNAVNFQEDTCVLCNMTLYSCPDIMCCGNATVGYTTYQH
jgi:PhzF family phenazine biosynthesis protein